MTQLVADHSSKKRFHRRRYERVAALVLANLIKSEAAWLRYPRGRDAYCRLEVPKGIGCDALVNMMKCLFHLGLVEGKLGYFDRARRQGAASLARGTPSFHRLVAEAARREQIRIELPVDLELLVCRDFPGKIGEPPEAKLWRQELAEYNALLAASTILGDGPDPLRAQYLCRIFNRSWCLGGRFYRGSWQNMPGWLRRLLRIDGEEVVELDFGELHLRILYADEGIDYSGDAYEVEGVERKLMKSTALIAINARTQDAARRSIQHAMNRGLLPKTHPPSELLQKFAEAHPLLGKHLCRDVGLRLQNRDAEIVRRVLRDMTREGILALPVHDSFLVAQHHEERLRQSMRSAYVDLLGVEPKITVEFPTEDVRF